ncbi:MAG TPA: hypothetical protein VEB22_03830 [Phycisphaerales bacterium]|nr:hypothetical protein [Phycisphaerales bacterium]
MRATALPGILLLRKGAILDAFNSRWSLLVGVLLVLSAAIARNYDGEDLLAEPWWLAAPFGASILTSLVLWLLFIPWARLPAGQTWRLYPRFLGLYWLTAPLAWLYAIPYERFLSPVDAVHANACTLLVVSLWRVLIVARSLSIIFSIRFRAALAFTLMFGALVMLVAALFGPRPVLDVMGGLRLPPEDRARAALTFNTGFFSAVALLVFGIWAAAARPQSTTPLAATPPPLPARMPAVTLAAAITACLIWLPALFVAQPQQRNRHSAESAFERAEYATMLAALSRQTLSDYPPNWRLPGSHLPAYQRVDRLNALLPHLSADTARWVRDGYTAMARDSILFHIPFAETDDWVRWTVKDAGHYLNPEQAPAVRSVLTWLAANDDTLTDDQRAQLIAHLTPSAVPPSSPP